MSREEMVPIDDAIEQVNKTATRLALLHLGFSNILVKEFGEEKATEKEDFKNNSEEWEAVDPLLLKKT